MPTRRSKKQVIKPLERRSPEGARTTPPTELEKRMAKTEGAVWVPKWVSVGRSRRRLAYIKTTPEREATAANIRASRANDFLLMNKGRQTRDAGRVVKSGANLSPWLYGGLKGRYRRVFGTPEGKEFVDRLERVVKKNASKGKTTHLLDIGAGLAQYWNPVLRRLKRHGKVELHVLNPSLAGKEHSPADHWRVGAIETKGFERRQFDGVLCVYGGFDKANHPTETLQKMVRLTKPGGVQYVIFGRKELGEGVPVTRGRIREALSLVDPKSRIVSWKEPTGPRKDSQGAYRKDLIFTRGRKVK